jgi:hypothetical protein
MHKGLKIPWANRNHTGWWIFEEVEQWVSNRQKRLSPTSRYLVRLNLRLVQAKSREVAHRKAMKFGAAGMPSKTNGGEWRFVGISMLLPVYDRIEDGAEILWKGDKMMSVASIKKLVRTKRQLPLFNDTEEET